MIERSIRNTACTTTRESTVMGSRFVQAATNEINPDLSIAQTCLTFRKSELLTRSGGDGGAVS